MIVLLAASATEAFVPITANAMRKINALRDLIFLIEFILFPSLSRCWLYMPTIEVLQLGLTKSADF